MKLKELIRRLTGDKAEYYNDQVEFVIVRKSDGAIIAMELEGQAQNLGKVLELFKGGR